jgi:hypothetical protein
LTSSRGGPYDCRLQIADFRFQIEESADDWIKEQNG